MELGGLDSAKFRREHLIDYKAYGGQRIWALLNEEVNAHYDVKDGTWTIFRIIDQGIRHPTVCLWVAVNAKGDRHVFKEFYAEDRSIAMNCRSIHSLTDENIAATYIDPSTRKRTAESLTPMIDIYAENGIYCSSADNSFVGYDKVHTAIISTLARVAIRKGKMTRGFEGLSPTQDQLMTLADKPALTFDLRFTPRCFQECCNLRWQEHKGDQTQSAPKEKPVDKEDDGPDCCSSDTQILTDVGWKYFGELDKTEKVLTVDLENDCYEYQRPTEYIAKDYDGDLVKLSNQKGSFLFTPNHRMIVYSHTKKGRNPNYKIKLSRELVKTDTLKLVSNWKGKNYKRIFKEDAGDFAEFLGWYISEGSLEKPQCPGHGYGVVISQKPGESNDHIFNLCNKFRWNFNRWNSKIYASSKELWNFLNPLGRKSWLKKVPQIIKSASPEIIDRFLNGYLGGDGWMHRGHRNWATTSPKLADDIQELILKVGKSASIRIRPAKKWHIRGRSGNSRKQYHVYERSMSGFGLTARWNRGGIEKESYSGKVYCVSVPNQTIVIRRNGSPLIVGNCVRYAITSGLWHKPTDRQIVSKTITMNDILASERKHKTFREIERRRIRRAYD